MAALMLNRRSNIDRRREYSQPENNRRGIDRREQVYNGYMLMIGEQGFDAFSLFVMVPVALVLGAAFVVSFILAY